MVKNSLAFLAVVAMVLFVQPVRADMLYDSGVAWNLTPGQLGISGTGYVADPFTISAASTITSIDLGLYNGEHSPPTTLSYAIYGTSGAAITTATATLAILQQNPTINPFRFQAEFLLNVHLDPGTYYLRLYNGLAVDGHEIGWGWGETNTLTSWSGSPVTVDFRTIAPNVSAESFIINGRPDTVPSVPEPATMLLLGLGMVGLAGVRRFK